MCRVCFLLLLGAACTRARSKVVIWQDPQDVVIHVGEELTFQCSMEGCFAMTWYREGEQGRLTWVPKEEYGDYRNDSVEDHGFGDESSENTSQSRHTVQESALADSGLYY
ncbi:hypothetical protein Y1Q_0010583 [Alligator mississippiensis]|uniref:Ig-like domain-containing protein n=1 Tax=Alligator mississippiensis TaxID=8496 RepID=A0A151PH27_ALLMI|nr:hypothetical protein Y1Q_0010583 [Alligator mississippiensis]